MSGLPEHLFFIAWLHHHQGCTAQEAARGLGVSVPALEGLFEQLSLVGRPPFEVANRVSVYFDDDGRIYTMWEQGLERPMGFTLPEATALCAALGALAGEGGGPLAGAARSLLGKLRSALREEVRRDADELARRVAQDEPDAAQAGPLAALQEGHRRRRRVAITYWTASRDTLTERVVAPCGLVLVGPHWYAVGHDSASGEVRVFRVDRVREARLTAEPFQVPPDFDLGAYRTGFVAGHDPARARVRFYPPAARRIAEEWDPRYIEERHADGSLTARMDYLAAEGLAAWILAHGDGAEALEPAELREAVARRAAEALEGYR